MNCRTTLDGNGSGSSERARDVKSRELGQLGFGMIEVLVSLALIGTVMVALIGGLMFSVAASTRGVANASAQTTAVGVVERLKTMPYRPCATPAQLDADYSTFAARFTTAGASVRVMSVRYGDTSASFLPIGSACVRDVGVQLIAVRVDVRDERAVIETVLRDPTTRPA